MSRADNDSFEPSPLSLLDLHPAERDKRLGADVQDSLLALKQALALSVSAQEEIMGFRERYDRLPDSTPLAPRSLRSIRDGRSVYLGLQGRLIELAERYTLLIPGEGEHPNPLQLDRIDLTKAVLISLVASLTLYDNHLSMRTVLEDDRLRRLIKSPSRGYGMHEDEIVAALQDLNSSDRQRRLESLVRAYDRVADTLAGAGDPDIDFLQMAVASNAAYRYTRESILEQRLPTVQKRMGEQLLDALDNLGKSTLGAVSELFGNGIGLVETRKGKLWRDRDLERHLSQTLQPLDLLLEKTPFRLTDKFIPGHFGHVAVWLGSAAELTELGIFTDPLFQEPAFAPCEAQVRGGRSLLEALRTGVQLSTLAEFLNVDDLAVLRISGMTPEEQRASLIRAFRQVGKQYDFNFEVETLDRITCSELPYHVFPDVAWDTEEQLGQHTISPDQVASQALSTTAPFQLLEFRHDGKLVEAEEALPLMARLIDYPTA